MECLRLKKLKSFHCKIGVAISMYDVFVGVIIISSPYMCQNCFNHKSLIYYNFRRGLEGTDGDKLDSGELVEM